MRCSVELGGSETLTLQGAVLVYRSSSRRSAFAAWHPVQHTPGAAPALAAGQPLTTAFLRELAEGLGAQVRAEVLPENVLARTPDRLVWWVPAQQPFMFFPTADPKLAPLNGRRFPHPALVFKVSGRDLSVRALERDERPNATRLKTAPYFNVNEAGLCCQGTMRSPEGAPVETMSGWEKAFFQSEFTHAYGAVRLTSYPRGFIGLWKSLAGKRRFPHVTPADLQHAFRIAVLHRTPCL
jgi:PRTRC genetic system protein B